MQAWPHAHGRRAGRVRRRGDDPRLSPRARRLGAHEIIVPQAAHGTNPATAPCAAARVEGALRRERRRRSRALRRRGPEDRGHHAHQPVDARGVRAAIEEVARIVHEAGGLLYYDGANLNAILGKVRPGDMGFDVIHMNLHKTFSTPHGGGGPGSGAVGVGARLLPFLPMPIVGATAPLSLADRARSAAVDRPAVGLHGQRRRAMLRAYIYMRMLGREGMVRVAEFATLNANYL
jgi:glycine dehydrogenase subunit 2